MREVIDEMNIKGIRTKLSGKVSFNSVTRVLHNRKYIGEYKYRDIVQPNGNPAIVLKELFDRVQERMKETKNRLPVIKQKTITYYQQRILKNKTDFV